MSTEFPVWSALWPTESGLYWFYGKRFGEGDEKLYFVEAYKSGNSLVTLVGNGHFWYKGENHQGKWLPVTLPSLPLVNNPNPSEVGIVATAEVAPTI